MWGVQTTLSMASSGWRASSTGSSSSPAEISSTLNVHRTGDHGFFRRLILSHRRLRAAWSFAGLCATASRESRSCVKDEDREFSIPQRELRVFAHHLRGPGRVEHHLRVHLLDAVELADE